MYLANPEVVIPVGAVQMTGEFQLQDEATGPRAFLVILRTDYIYVLLVQLYNLETA